MMRQEIIFFPELEDDEFWDEYCEGEGVDE